MPVSSLWVEVTVRLNTVKQLLWQCKNISVEISSFLPHKLDRATVHRWLPMQVEGADSEYSPRGPWRPLGLCRSSCSKQEEIRFGEQWGLLQTSIYILGGTEAWPYLRSRGRNNTIHIDKSGIAWGAKIWSYETVCSRLNRESWI